MKWERIVFCPGFSNFKDFSNIPLEHTPDPESTVYEGIPFILGFADAWGMLQGYVGVLLENSYGEHTNTTDDFDGSFNG